MKAILPDPQKFMAAGICSIPQAAVLVHIGRTGLQGCRIHQIAEGIRLPEGTSMPESTASSICYRLRKLGFLTRFGRSNQRGRHFFWIITGKGWDLLTQDADVAMFPGALDKLKGGAA